MMEPHLRLLQYPVGTLPSTVADLETKQAERESSKSLGLLSPPALEVSCILSQTKMFGPDTL